MVKSAAKSSQTHLPDTADTLTDTFVSAEEEQSLVSLYRDLSATEQDRVWHFADDARERDRHPDLAARYVPIEFLQTFLGQQAEFYTGKQDRADVCRLMDMDEGQYFRVASAWETIKTVSEEVEAFARKTYGPEAEGSDTAPPARPLPPGSLSVVLVTDGEGPLLFRHEPTGTYVALLDAKNPKRDAVRLLCGLLSAQVEKQIP